MKPVTFVQYIRPRGRKRPGHFNVPDHVAAQAHQLQAAGMSFEMELLTTGEVSLTVVGHDSDGEEADLDIELATNGPGLVAAAAVRLIERVYLREIGHPALPGS